mgnify:CR=1 FL=1
MNDTPLSAEQELELRTEEFMQRRYEFRYNTMTTITEYREICVVAVSVAPMSHHIQEPAIKQIRPVDVVARNTGSKLAPLGHCTLLHPKEGIPDPPNRTKCIPERQRFRKKIQVRLMNDKPYSGRPRRGRIRCRNCRIPESAV